ncbi:nacht domain-containing protein [Fusarium mundagurra]|uniref:Nacht domain-containing protein n=1 Tax=Fusarium mundagurra TaxID=1567541 RepID=A0A8H5XUT7_9HYPO|nr:nacht domain-containing protein [Fusarium mundagurra]
MDLTQYSPAVTSSTPKKGDQILQNAINSFRTVLTPKELAEFENIQSLPDADAVLVFTAELDLRRQNQKGKSIASRLFPVLQAVHNFTSVIDTLVSSNPTIAALVWGSVKMTMTIMLNAASYYEAFVELCMELGSICPRFEQYQALFPASERLQEALCTFNACIIQCCRRVIAMPKSSSGWTSPLNPLNPSFWQSFQQVFESDLQKLRDHSKNVNKEIRLAADQSQYRNNELQRLENEQADRSRRSLSRFMSRTRDDFDTMQRLQARQKRYPKSAEWIFGTDEFKRWVDGTTPGLLWCFGKLGSGKSIICASVIDYLLTQQSSAGSRVTFFFSRFDDSKSMRADTILRALARQLITVQDVSGDTKRTLETIQSATKDISPELSRLLTHLLSKKGPPSWVILDGIDECQREERQTIFKVLGSMLNDVVNAKLFITSRDHATSIFKGDYVNLEQVSMNCSLAQDGMARLVDQAVQKCLDAEELLVNDQTLIAEIKNTLTQHADGICQAAFNASQLEECCLISPLQEYTIRDRYVNGIHLIDTWFQGLVEVDYETKTVHFIHTCIQQFFLTASEKPAFSDFHVRIEEADRHIGDICVTYLNFSDFNTTLVQVRPRLPPIAPNEICQNALRNEWSWPRLLRLSQKVRGHKRRAADIDATIASCTRVSDTTVQEMIILDHPFLAYASAHWLSHSVHFDKVQSQTWRLWKKMLTCGHELAASPVSEEHHQNIDKALVLWATHNKHSALLYVVAASTELIEQFHPILFDYVLQESDVKLLHRILDTKTWDSTLDSLFCDAAHTGRLEIVKTLFEAGVDTNAYGSLPRQRHGLPLIEAAAKDQIEVIKYLLQKGANPDLQTASYYRAFELAALLGGSKGFQACKLFIDAGVNVRDTQALLKSCVRGDREIIELLLSAGADINALYSATDSELISVGIWINY